MRQPCNPQNYIQHLTVHGTIGHIQVFLVNQSPQISDQVNVTQPTWQNPPGKIHLSPGKSNCHLAKSNCHLANPTVTWQIHLFKLPVLPYILLNVWSKQTVQLGPFLALLDYVSRAHGIAICPPSVRLCRNLISELDIFVNMGPYGSENFKTLLLLQIAAKCFETCPEFSSQWSS